MTMIEADRDLGERMVDGLPHVWAEVEYAVQREMAMSIGDVLFRRTHLYHLDRDHALGIAPAVAERLARHLGWDDRTRDREVAAYAAAVDERERFRTEIGVTESTHDQELEAGG